MLSIQHISIPQNSHNVTLVASIIRICWELRASGWDACCVQLGKNEYINQTLKLLFKQIA